MFFVIICHNFGLLSQHFSDFLRFLTFSHQFWSIKSKTWVFWSKFWYFGQTSSQLCLFFFKILQFSYVVLRFLTFSNWFSGQNWQNFAVLTRNFKTSKVYSFLTFFDHFWLIKSKCFVFCHNFGLWSQHFSDFLRFLINVGLLSQKLGFSGQNFGILVKRCHNFVFFFVKIFTVFLRSYVFLRHASLAWLHKGKLAPFDRASLCSWRRYRFVCAADSHLAM